MKEKNSSLMIKLPFMLGIAICAGIFIGATFAGGNSNENSVFNSILKFREIITYIDRDYVDEVDTEELVESAITEMLEDLDPHTSYIPARDLEISKSELEGGFDGIGIEFSIIRDTITVVAPLGGGPSEALGIQTGDKIIAVDGETVAGIGITNRGVMDRLRGKKGSKVDVLIQRRKKDEPLEFTITRDKIPQYSLDASYMLNDEVGYIKINRFSATTFEEFKNALAELQGKGMSKLILDLQGNPGGYMDRAIDMADEFLPGNPMIVYTEGKEKRYNTRAYARKPGIFEEQPLIVLLDQGSASASEIVAGALQDNDRALIVGRRSFGKGLVQRPIELTDGSELRLTISRYYVPSGRSIQKPYEAGTDDYDQEVLDRYNAGEFFSADSIKFNDSLRYETAGGRTVYGGGGIMPDVFVPIDTTYNSAYMNRLFTSNAIGEWTLEYYQKNQKKLEKMDYEDFRANFEISKKMLDNLVAMAEEVGVKYNEEQYLRSLPELKVHIKAWIARRVWGNEGFFPIYNQTNEVLQEAIKHFDEAEDLSLLEQK